MCCNPRAIICCFCIGATRKGGIIWTQRPTRANGEWVCMLVLCSWGPNKYSLEHALFPDISATITPLAPQLHSAGTAHKKERTAVCRPRILHASHFLLLWFEEVWIYLVQPSACQYKMHMHYTILSAPRLISSASWLVCVCVCVYILALLAGRHVCFHHPLFSVLGSLCFCAPPADVKA